MIKDGYLEWDPTMISALTVAFPITFDYSEPKLDFDDKIILENMLNDHVGDRKLKDEIVKTFNAQYFTLLKDHLNTEQVIGTLNITYNYAGISLSYLNAVKEYELSDTGVKGL